MFRLHHQITGLKTRCAADISCANATSLMVYLGPRASIRQIWVLILTPCAACVGVLVLLRRLAGSSNPMPLLACRFRFWLHRRFAMTCTVWPGTANAVSPICKSLPRCQGRPVRLPPQSLSTLGNKLWSCIWQSHCHYCSRNLQRQQPA